MFTGIIFTRCIIFLIVRIATHNLLIGSADWYTVMELLCSRFVIIGGDSRVKVANFAKL